MNEVESLMTRGYRPFGVNDSRVYLNSKKTYTWKNGSGPNEQVISLRYDPELKWVLSIPSQPTSIGLRGDTPIPNDWDQIVERIGSAADQPTFEQQYNCHALGGLVEQAFGNGTWDLESSRPSNPGWSGGALGRVWESDQFSAACSW